VRTVSARLTLLHVALTAAILATFSLSLYLWVREGLERDLEKELDVQARQFQDWFLEELAELRRGVHPDLREPLQRFLEASGALAEVRGGDGRVLFASEGFIPGRPGFRERTTALALRSGESFRMTFAIPEEPVLQPLRQLRVYFAIFCPLVLVAAGLLGHLFVRRALAPVEEIRRQAERISRANVSERVPEPPSEGEFRNLARTFNEMLERLDRAFQDLQNFAADAAHELRTPLANLRAEIETAIQQDRSPEESHAVLASMAEEVARMSRIVTDLFTLAKIDMRQYALQRERVRLRPLLEDARETWQGAAADRKIEILTEGADAEVAGDPVALRRVFMNLVENAVKYNREGGRVTLSLERHDGHVRVRVRDTGIGIPAEHLPRLFHRFYRVDKARSRESGGAGLGLAICKSLIEAHEGTIAVASRPGEGTTFTVELPAAVAPTAGTP
jgi:heavy metal sensor kinase